MQFVDFCTILNIREELFRLVTKLGLIKKDKYISKYYKISTYIDSKNRTQKKYFLTEEGFINICSQYRGLKAEAFREVIIENYIAQRAVIQ